MCVCVYFTLLQLCVSKVVYSEFDTALPVVRRVGLLLRGLRDAVSPAADPLAAGADEMKPPGRCERGRSREDETRPVRASAEAEKRPAAGVESTPRSSEFVRQLLRSDDFLTADDDRAAAAEDLARGRPSSDSWLSTGPSGRSSSAESRPSRQPARLQRRRRPPQVQSTGVEIGPTDTGRQ